MKDLRTLCKSCTADMLNAGYRLFRTDKLTRGRCDKCGRPGIEFELKEPKKR